MKSGKHISVISAIHHTSIVIVIALGSFFIFSQHLNKIQLFALALVVIGTFLLTLYDTH
jgi:multidrug transporter EmrE-like cation transporter